MTPTTEIQQYSSARDNKGTTTTVQQAIDTIRENKLSPFVLNIRRYVAKIAEAKAELQTATDPERIAELEQSIKECQWTVDATKKELPAVTWSGTFSTRAAKNLQQYSGLICIDVDKLQPEALAALIQAVKEDTCVFAAFISPSGNGLKIIYKVPANADKHKEYFLTLEMRVSAKYGVPVDPSGKDVSRLCFLSMDADLYYNPDCETYTPFFEDTPADTPTAAQAKAATSTPKEIQHIELTGDTAADVWRTTSDYMQYATGQRNSFIYKFACNCNRKGIDMTDAEAEAIAQATDLDQREVITTIRSAYTHNAAEWGKYKKNPKKNATKVAKSTKNGSNDTTNIGNSVFPGNDGGNSGPGNAGHDVNTMGHHSGNAGNTGPAKTVPKFWYETEDKKNTDENGEALKRFNIHYTGLIDFLSHHGYYRLPLPNKTYEFIHYDNNVCDTVPPEYTTDFVFNWISKNQAAANQQDDKDTWTQMAGVREMLYRGVERYFSVKKLATLPYKKLEFVKDTPDSAFFFFRNCYVKVTKDRIETRPISELHKTLWRNDIIDRDFKLEKIDYPESDKGFDIENVKCEFAQYMMMVSSNPKKYGEVSKETVLERFYSHCSAVGYMLHGYKSPIGKAVIAVDHKVPEDKTEQNGGTGKSIYGNSFKYLKSTCVIDGREFNDQYPFRFEPIGVDTKIVVMQDCRYNLDFGSFFVPITSDFKYNKRHTGYITLVYEDSPKWWFDTNFTFKGEGSSFRRRQHIIEFDDFFDDTHNPADQFGHMLFKDWDDAEWNRFYNHYFQCVQIFLMGGLIDYPASNYDSRRLLTETPIEFIDFLDAHEEKNGKIEYKVGRNRWLIKKELMRMWNDEATALNMHKVSPHQFTKWVKKYCRNKNLRHINSKSNGVEYYIFADATYNGPTKFTGTPDLFQQK